MYLKHFGFKRKPFIPAPDHRELFQTRAHREVRARLRIALHDRVPSLVVGDPGVGKSTSMRSVLAEIDARAHRLIEISDPRLELRSFYRTLAIGLGLQPRFFFGDLTEQVRDALMQTVAKNKRHPVLVVDEAHLLTHHTLDSLRLLTNAPLGQSQSGITLLLVGDMTLIRRLRKPYFEAFVQRLRMTYRMPPVDDEEGRRYVAHRIRVAGADPDLFEPDAVEAILAEAGGRLRKIDDLCTQALYAAYIAKNKIVTKDQAHTVIAERIVAD